MMTIEGKSGTSCDMTSIEAICTSSNIATANVADIMRMYAGQVLIANELGGEQPETSALPKPGALRGDVPLSSPDKEIK